MTTDWKRGDNVHTTTRDYERVVQQSTGTGRLENELKTGKTGPVARRSMEAVIQRWKKGDMLAVMLCRIES